MEKLNKEAIMYYEGTVFKSDNSHVQVSKVLKIKDQFEGKRTFIELVNKELNKGDYLVGVNGNMLNVEEKDIIIK